MLRALCGLLATLLLLALLTPWCLLRALTRPAPPSTRRPLLPQP